MKDKISFAVLSPSEATRAVIAQGLSGTGAIRVVADAARSEELAHALQSAAQIGIYVDLDGEPEKALGWIESLVEPKPPVLAGGPSEPALILRAMRAGALAYFPDHQFDEELVRVARRVQETVAAETPPKAGHVLAVLGVKDKYRGSGIPSIFALETMDRAVAAGYEYGHCGWTLEDNEDVNAYAKAIGGEVFQRYRIYDRAVRS